MTLASLGRRSGERCADAGIRRTNLDMEPGLRRLEDRSAIGDLVVGYLLAADADDLVKVGASFTQDATFSSLDVRGARRT